MYRLPECYDIDDVVLLCITRSGRCEDDLLADYNRKCTRLKIVPIYGQVKESLKRLYRAGKIKILERNGHKLCARV